MGLNASSGNGNSNTKYWGEYYIDRDIQMATNAVVILNRLCYASGNSEWGSANPTKSTAIKRVDNYGAGFLRAGAKAVFAEAITSASYTIGQLFKIRSDHELDLHDASQRQRRPRLLVHVRAARPGHGPTSDPPQGRQVLAIRRSATSPSPRSSGAPG